MNRSIFLFLLLGCVAFGQTESEERFYFQLTIVGGAKLEISQNSDKQFVIINPNNNDETRIYAAYNVYDFQKAFKNSSRELLKEVYNIETDNVALISNLKHNFPDRYTRIDQYYPDEKPYYPNDYGLTSPVENLGANERFDDLDLLELPKAWGITTGSKKVVMGISDSKVDSTNLDFKGQVSQYLSYVNSGKGMSCAHGSNVAGIAGAAINNGYGRAGICPGCDMIVHGYGTFKVIEDLVEAGAKVINTSWVLCNMGSLHENIEERINELYEDGIIIVAAAGNGKGCNKDGFDPDDYGYPNAFEKVISVTGTFVTNDYDTAPRFKDDNGREIIEYVKDRHASKIGFKADGSAQIPYPKYGMQANNAIDITAPAYTYLLGSHICYGESKMGGVTSGAAPFVTGVIGLIWSENYCLSSYEVESILKLSSEEIENLEGNTRYRGKLGAGRVNAYRAVKMARETKELFGNVEVSNRDMYRYHYRLENAPYNITVKNQTFRDSASVRFKARNAIYLKPGTTLRPDKTSRMTFKIDATTPTGECFPEPPKVYERLYKK
tara:strand:- start:35587 stop:37242 length:1656 start_codon:yes stop_codon:yes gene_type:complete